MLKLNSFYKKLKYNGSEKLSKISLLLLIFLDIFVYIAINYGIDFQTDVIINPNVEYPYECREMVNSKNIKNKIFNFYNYKNYRYDEIYQKEMNTKCKDILDSAFEISQLKVTKNIKSEINSLKNKRNKIQAKISQIRDDYKLVLFEKIANIESNSTVQKARNKLKTLNQEISELEIKISHEYKKFYSNSDLIELEQKIVKYREQINQNYETGESFYKLKIYLIEILFVLPVIFIFYKLMEYNRVKLNFVHFVIYKHLFIVSMIPFFTTFLSFFYDYIPKTLIENFINFFYNLDIPFFVYYLLIIIAVILATFLVLRVQKYFLKKEKNQINYISSFRKSECFECQNRVNYETMNFCPHCGNILKIKCTNCETLTFKNLPFCHSCGKSKTQITQNR